MCNSILGWSGATVTLGVALLALFSAQVAVIITHWLTARREKIKATVDKENQRRELLRVKLERIVELLMTRLSELYTRGDAVIPLAATLAVGSPMPWKYNEIDLVSDSLIQAQTLINLYFAELVDDVLVVERSADGVRRFIDNEMLGLRQDPKAWLSSSATSYPDRFAKQLDLFKDALVNIQLKARHIMDSRLLVL
jgi:hypothetical protein